MKFLIPILILSSSIASVGCSHTHKIDGVQGADTIPAGIRVRLGSAEVKDGDDVDVFKPVCTMSIGNGRRGGPIKKCVNEKVGGARILKVLDHDSAVIEPADGLRMISDMIVEKRKQ